jgi:hypothetical protein
MKEIKQLTPVIASPFATPIIGCSSPDIRFTTRNTNGAIYLIAVNGSKNAVAAKFDVAGAGKAAADVIFEDRRALVAGGILEDTFAGYQRHVYRIKPEK